MRRSAFQLADLRILGQLKKPTQRQFDTLALALRKQRDEALKYRKLYEEEQRRAALPLPPAPHATQRLVTACEELIEHRKRMRQDVWNGHYGRIQTELQSIKHYDSQQALIRRT